MDVRGCTWVNLPILPKQLMDTEVRLDMYSKPHPSPPPPPVFHTHSTPLPLNQFSVQCLAYKQKTSAVICLPTIKPWILKRQILLLEQYLKIQISLLAAKKLINYKADTSIYRCNANTVFY